MNDRNIRYFRRFWQARAALFCLFALLVTGLPLHGAHASLQEYTILATGTSNSSETADAIAMDFARKRAVYLAVKKLGFTDASTVAAKIGEKDLTQIIRGATVKQTRRVGTKTYAQISVSIADDVLRTVLNVTPSAEIAADKADNPIRNILILPALILPKDTYIWQKNNALRPPLSIELLRQGHGVVILPGGDLQDLRLVDKDNITDVTGKELEPMFTRYGADEIVLALVKPGEENSKEPTHIILRRLTRDHDRSETMELLPENAETPIAARIEQAARAIATVAVELATSSAESDRAKLAAATHIKARFVYTIPRELARMQIAVRTAPGVRLLELPTIGLNNVTGIIYLEGDKQQLRDYLARKTIVVREQEGTWMISTR